METDDDTAAEDSDDGSVDASNIEDVSEAQLVEGGRRKALELLYIALQAAELTMRGSNPAARVAAGRLVLDINLKGPFAQGETVGDTTERDRMAAAARAAIEEVLEVGKRINHDEDANNDPSSDETPH